MESAEQPAAARHHFGRRRPPPGQQTDGQRDLDAGALQQGQERGHERLGGRAHPLDELQRGKEGDGGDGPVMRGDRGAVFGGEPPRKPEDAPGQDRCQEPEEERGRRRAFESVEVGLGELDAALQADGEEQVDGEDLVGIPRDAQIAADRPREGPQREGERQGGKKVHPQDLHHGGSCRDRMRALVGVLKNTHWFACTTVHAFRGAYLTEAQRRCKSGTTSPSGPDLDLPHQPRPRLALRGGRAPLARSRAGRARGCHLPGGAEDPLGPGGGGLPEPRARRRGRARQRLHRAPLDAAAASGREPQVDRGPAHDGAGGRAAAVPAAAPLSETAVQARSAPAAASVRISRRRGERPSAGDCDAPPGIRASSLRPGYQAPSDGYRPSDSIARRASSFAAARAA